MPGEGCSNAAETTCGIVPDQSAGAAREAMRITATSEPAVAAGLGRDDVCPNREGRLAGPMDSKALCCAVNNYVVALRAHLVQLERPRDYGCTGRRSRRLKDGDYTRYCGEND